MSLKKCNMIEIMQSILSGKNGMRQNQQDENYKMHKYLGIKHL